jgi:hypothetical protein
MSERRRAITAKHSPLIDALWLHHDLGRDPSHLGGS